MEALTRCSCVCVCFFVYFCVFSKGSTRTFFLGLSWQRKGEVAGGEEGYGGGYIYILGSGLPDYS